MSRDDVALNVGHPAIVGQAANRIQPKYLIAGGLLIVALGMWHMTTLVPDADFSYFASARVWQMIGLPLLFIPINMVAYAGLPAEKANQASALINVALNLGGSLGGSLANAVAAQRAQFHQARLTEHLAPSLLTYQETIRRGSNSSSSTALRRQPPSIWSSAGSDNSMIPLALFLLRRIDRSTPNKHPLQEA